MGKAIETVLGDFYDAWRAQDLDWLASYLPDDFCNVMHLPSDIHPLAGTCQGKKLLFVGDAQWGNWAYWLYGKPVKGKDPGISDEARRILASIDFYKVGHHGSTNATPIPAVSAMPKTCVAMCSTETGFPSEKRTYGSIEKKTEVPRIALMEALEKQTGDKLVRSDWIAAGNAESSPEAHGPHNSIASLKFLTACGQSRAFAASRP